MDILVNFLNYITPQGPPERGNSCFPIPGPRPPAYTLLDMAGKIRGAHFRYLPVGPAERDWGIHVSAAGAFAIPPGSPYPLPAPRAYRFRYDRGRVLSEYAMVYVPRGRGTFESRETGPRPVTPGTLMLLFPGRWHRYRPDPRTGWDEYWVCFDGEHVRDLEQRGFLRPREPLHRAGASPGLAALFAGIMDTLRSGELGFAQVAAADALAVLARVLSASRRARRVDRRAEQVILKAKQLVVRAAAGPLRVPELARELGVGYSWLRQTFRQHTGLAPARYHAQVRLHKAQELLEGTDLSVKEIALELGYDTQSYFSRAFRKETGRWPTDWRAACRRASAPAESASQLSGRPSIRPARGLKSEG